MLLNLNLLGVKYVFYKYKRSKYAVMTGYVEKRNPLICIIERKKQNYSQGTNNISNLCAKYTLYTIIVKFQLILFYKMLLSYTGAKLNILYLGYIYLFTIYILFINIYLLLLFIFI